MSPIVVMKITKGYLSVAIVLVILLIDQITKIWVKTHFYIGESVEITPWFFIHFIENNGMAFGMEIGSKYILTAFRIAVVAGLTWYLSKTCSRDDIPTGYIICLSAIIAGAAGNIIDCMFYGLIFNNPYPPEVATLFPGDGGYAPIMLGRVVDMLYFPLFSFDWPQWIPIIGGKNFLFFQPVFNIADAAISVGMVALVIFYSKYLGSHYQPDSPENQKTPEQ